MAIISTGTGPKVLCWFADLADRFPKAARLSAIGMALLNLSVVGQTATPDQTPTALAESYLESGRFTDAIALLAPLERAQGGDPKLEWLLGNALIGAGRLPEGAPRLEKVATETGNPHAYLLAGQARFSMGQYDLARRDADAAARLSPELAGLATLKGMVFEQTSDYKGAESALTQALVEDPNDFNAHFYLGANFYFQRNMTEARKHLTRALELQPASVQVQYELALVDRAEGKLDQALKELEAVTAQMPDWLQPHIELSALYYRLHRPVDGEREKQLVDRMMAALQQSQSEAARPAGPNTP